eukprot:GHVT01058845.1.p1 GENE.GHVT01058845.1~~GHVT01058845.1.p1  ORF type:complete len:1009 (-),score=275.01 GHVT01058845.1:671-3271(-)
MTTPSPSPGFFSASSNDDEFSPRSAPAATLWDVSSSPSPGPTAPGSACSASPASTAGQSGLQSQTSSRETSRSPSRPSQTRRQLNIPACYLPIDPRVTPTEILDLVRLFKPKTVILPPEFPLPARDSGTAPTPKWGNDVPSTAATTLSDSFSGRPYLSAPSSSSSSRSCGSRCQPAAGANVVTSLFRLPKCNAPSVFVLNHSCRAAAGEAAALVREADGTVGWQFRHAVPQADEERGTTETPAAAAAAMSPCPPLHYEVEAQHLSDVAQLLAPLEVPLALLQQPMRSKLYQRMTTAGFHANSNTEGAPNNPPAVNNGEKNSKHDRNHATFSSLRLSGAPPPNAAPCPPTASSRPPTGGSRTAAPCHSTAPSFPPASCVSAAAGPQRKKRLLSPSHADLKKNLPSAWSPLLSHMRADASEAEKIVAILRGQCADEVAELGAAPLAPGRVCGVAPVKAGSRGKRVKKELAEPTGGGAALAAAVLLNSAPKAEQEGTGRGSSSGNANVMLKGGQLATGKVKGGEAAEKGSGSCSSAAVGPSVDGDEEFEVEQKVRPGNLGQCLMKHTADILPTVWRLPTGCTLDTTNNLTKIVAPNETRTNVGGSSSGGGGRLVPQGPLATKQHQELLHPSQQRQQQQRQSNSQKQRQQPQRQLQQQQQLRRRQQQQQGPAHEARPTEEKNVQQKDEATGTHDGKFGFLFGQLRLHQILEALHVAGMTDAYHACDSSASSSSPVCVSSSGVGSAIARGRVAGDPLAASGGSCAASSCSSPPPSNGTATAASAGVPAVEAAAVGDDPPDSAPLPPAPSCFRPREYERSSCQCTPGCAIVVPSFSARVRLMSPLQTEIEAADEQGRRKIYSAIAHTLVQVY